jgi:hypothetical protein
MKPFRNIHRRKLCTKFVRVVLRLFTKLHTQHYTHGYVILHLNHYRTLQSEGVNTKTHNMQQTSAPASLRLYRICSACGANLLLRVVDNTKCASIIGEIFKGHKHTETHTDQSKAASFLRNKTLHNNNVYYILCH